MKTWDALRCAMAASVLVCSSAQAALFRAYLASNGNDANPCTLQAPCRLLPAALNAVATGGEIWMLDSANYNTARVNIFKSVSILAVPGAVGSLVSLNSQPAIAVSQASTAVSLRNVVIGPVAGSQPGDGVVVAVSAKLTIEDSVIAGVNYGVRVTSLATLWMRNTTIRNCNIGVRLEGGASASIHSSYLMDLTRSGVFAYGDTATSTSASISDSLISGGGLLNLNSPGGSVVAQADATGAMVRIGVSRSTIERSFVSGLLATTNGNGAATIEVSASTLVNHVTAWSQSGAGSSIVSLGNNLIRDYTTTVGSLTTVSLQ